MTEGKLRKLGLRLVGESRARTLEEHILAATGTAYTSWQWGSTKSRSYYPDTRYDAIPPTRKNESLKRTASHFFTSDRM